MRARTAVQAVCARAAASVQNLVQFPVFQLVLAQLVKEPIQPGTADQDVGQRIVEHGHVVLQEEGAVQP